MIKLKPANYSQLNKWAELLGTKRKTFLWIPIETNKQLRRRLLKILNRGCNADA